MTGACVLRYDRRMSHGPQRWIESWLERHRSRASLVLHAIGIPLTVVAVGHAVYLAVERPSASLWWIPLSVFFLGYFLQYLGHRHEGNDMGELILVKRIFGRP